MNNEKQLIEAALSGDKAALDTLVDNIGDMVFNLSLRMLGMIHDAEDASQEIMLKIITALPGFRMESSLSTWVFRIAVNYLKDYKKGMFAMRPLSFEIYGEDIAQKLNVPDMTGGVDRALLEEELKMSCSNVMLQCFEPETRCIFVLGTMFGVNSKAASEILGITPEAYRQRLSRARKKMAGFLEEYCQLGGSEKSCSCAKRVDYAIQTHRINPQKPDYQSMKQLRTKAFTEAMEQLDSLSQVFADLPAYAAPDYLKNQIRNIMASKPFDTISQ